MPWLSVVTVVKDDPEGFARSQESLAGQDVADVEWVIVDGSTDRSAIPDLLGIDDSAIPTRYEHRAPAGIYDAMNAALARCCGEYVYFLNAGDELLEASVLRRVRQALSGSPVWAFGPVEIHEIGGNIVVTPSWDYQKERAASFSRGVFPSHQGTFARVHALRSAGGFDSTFSVAADYAVFLKLSLLGDPVRLPFVIAAFREGGTSTKQWQRSFSEFHRARREILKPSGAAGLREIWATAIHYSLVFAHREVRPRLSWPKRPSP